MYKIFLKMCFFSLIFVSISANARMVSDINLPEQIFSYLNEKYPKAEDFTAVEKTHFGRSFYEVNFKLMTVDKNNKSYLDDRGELFHKSNGHIFTNVITVQPNNFNVISAAAKKTLNLSYPGYKMLGMKMVVNPDGVGEEYEIDLMVSGKLLNISMNNKGKVFSETRL